MNGASLVKGGQRLSGTDVKKSTILSNKNNQDSTSPKAQSSSGEIDMIVLKTIEMYKARYISVDTFASMIVGRIRVRFVNAIRRNKENSEFGYEITSFKYLDEILFNDLVYVISTVAKYGKRGTLTISQVMRMITDTANVIEYYIPETDLNEIKNILGAVYDEF